MKEDIKDDLRYLRESLLFPYFTGVGKAIIGIYLINSATNPIIHSYLVLSGLCDITEVACRGLINTNTKIPYSCLERHILYDIPKFIVNKIKKKEN